MGRKKKKAGVRDARGYQQGGAATNRTQQQTKAPTTDQKKASSSSLGTNLSITASVHQDLEDLLASLRKDDKPPPPPPTEPEASDRFAKRVGNLYDKLTALGFGFSDIQRAVQHLGYAVTYELALDWLCVHLRTEELPPLFTEGQVRDEVHGATTSLTVLAASRTSSQNEKITSRSDDDFLQKMQESSVSAVDLKKRSREEEASHAAQKEWLLQQYQYEEGEEAVDEQRLSPEPADSPAVAETIPDTEMADVALTSDEVETAAVQPIISPEELRFREMKVELDQLEADLKDEAGNYMRSKHEIKEMQKKAKQLRKQVAGMERKVSRIIAEQEKEEEMKQPDTAEAAEEGCAGVSLFGNEEEEDDDEMMSSLDLFSSMEVSGEDGTKEDQPKRDEVNEADSSAAIVVPKDSVPKSWTGKTPKVILEEWCRKERLPRPTFTKRGPKGCSLSVKLDKSGRRVVEIRQQAGAYADAQHFAATRAMYQINPNLPLYRILPPFYRDAWVKWVSDAQEVKERAEEVVDSERMSKITQLIESITTASSTVSETPANKSSPIDELRGGGEHFKEIVETWDDMSDGEEEANERETSMRNPVAEESRRLRKHFEKRQRSTKYQDMLESRKALPVYTFRQEILETVAKNPVTIISAETGAGKTTQVPQFIITEALVGDSGSRVSILCTQPRRVAATSVAERVSDEMAEDSLGGMVGYQIRLEAKRSSDTRLLFCTTGVVLRRLVDNPTLQGISHVIVDEVHERQWQIDLLLVSLRTLLRGPRPDLKIVLMSATLDANLFSTFFNGAPLLSVPGRTFPVSHYYLEDLLEKTGHIVEEGSRCAKRGCEDSETVSLWVTTRGGEKRRETAAMESETDLGVSGDFVGYSLTTRRSMDRVNESILNYDLIEDTLGIICAEEQAFTPPEMTKLIDGSVLIFLPGLGEIRTLTERLLASRVFGNQKRFEIVPMHSTLSTSDQRRAFRKSRKGTRKIIISTNIAETSVTIPDVTCVIDSGLVREIQRDKRTGTQKLVSTWCSRANAKQRSGRAGRLHPGACLKLFSSKTEKIMKKTSEPELKRIPLEEICLTVLASGLATSCKGFLSETPEPPMDSAIDFALENLLTIGAITMELRDGTSQPIERLTPLGLHLTKLPIDARLGKMLIFGCMFKCLGAALTITACLSASQSPFASSVSESNLARAAHASFSDPSSDFLGLINIWDAYTAAVSSGTARRFCQDKYLNYGALREIGDARRQFLDLLCGIGFVERAEIGYDTNKRGRSEKLLTSSRYCSNDKDEQVLHCVCAAGLYPNVARLDSGNLFHRTEQLVVHSKSVNSKLASHPPSSWMVFHEKLGTGRRVSISTTCFIHPFSLMLFGPSMKVLHTERKVLVDDWIYLGVAAKTGVIFREIRDQVDRELKDYVQAVSEAHKTSQNRSATQVIDRIVDLLRRR